MTKWLEFLKDYKKSHPNLSYKDCMKEASKEYKGQDTLRGKGIPLSKIWNGIKTLGKTAVITSTGISTAILASQASLIMYLKNNPEEGKVFISKVIKMLKESAMDI